MQKLRCERVLQTNKKIPIRTIFEVKINQQINFSCFKTLAYISHHMKSQLTHSQPTRIFCKSIWSAGCRWMPTRDRKYTAAMAVVAVAAAAAINTRFVNMKLSRYYVQLKLTKKKEERKESGRHQSRSYQHIVALYGLSFQFFCFRCHGFWAATFNSTSFHRHRPPFSSPSTFATVMHTHARCAMNFQSECIRIGEIFRCQIRISIALNSFTCTTNAHTHKRLRKTAVAVGRRKYQYGLANVLKHNSSFHSEPKNPSAILRVVQANTTSRFTFSFRIFCANNKQRHSLHWVFYSEKSSTSIKPNRPNESRARKKSALHFEKKKNSINDLIN